MDKFKKELNLIILIILCWVAIVSLYFWNFHSAYDPFYLSRLTYFNPNILSFDSKLFGDVPFTYFYNIILIKLLGDTPIENGYIPLIQFISLFSLLALGKVICEKFREPYHSLYFIVPIVIFINVFLLVSPYQEYYISYALFILFLWAFYKYNQKNTSQLALILILLFVTIHCFAVPMSLWILELVISYFLLLTFGKLIKKDIKNQLSINFIILLLVIWFCWNYKFLLFIQMGTFDPHTITTLLKNIVYSQTSGGLLPAFEYSVVNKNPITKSAGIIFLLLILVPIALKFLYEFSRRNILFFMRSKKEAIMFSFMVPFIFEFILYGGIGTLSFRYLYLVYPLVSYFYILDSFSKKLTLGRFKLINFLKINNKKIIYIYLILLISSAIIVIDPQLNQKYSSLPPETLNSTSSWYYNNVPDSSYLATDFKTESYLKYYLKPINSEYQINRTLFTPQLYSYLINPKSTTKNITLDYLVLDVNHLNQPILQGPPAWVKLIPLAYHINEIDSNSNLNIIYDSNFTRIYKKNFI